MTLYCDKCEKKLIDKSIVLYKQGKWYCSDECRKADDDTTRFTLGDMIPIKEFIDSCEKGYFKDDDGHGYLYDELEKILEDMEK